MAQVRIEVEIDAPPEEVRAVVQVPRSVVSFKHTNETLLRYRYLTFLATQNGTPRS